MSTAAELISKAGVDARSLPVVEFDLVADNLNESASLPMSNMNNAPGTKEAFQLLMPAEDQDMIMAANKLRLTSHETN
jgi:hypothetical protein